MTLQVDTILNNRYLILEVIAQGGMGAIYRSQDQSLNVQVAIKENLFISDDSSRQFHREATILAGLRHPNLPRVIDHFVIPDQGQYLAMDYIEGEDIRERINRFGVLDEREVILIGAAICDAISYLHLRIPPIIHRDIKPGNIKITPDGHICLVDFGLAKVDQGVQTTIGAQSLTPGYAPPEQYGQGTDCRSDIYSLGATLYAALTGKVPEDGLARAMGATTLTPIRKYNPKVSEGLATTLNVAMAVLLPDRYQNAEIFKRDLLNSSSDTRSLNGETGNIFVIPPVGKTVTNSSPYDPIYSERPPTGPPRSGEFTQKKKTTLPFIPIIIAGFVILCVILIGGGLYIIGSGKSKQPSLTTAITIATSMRLPTLASPTQIAENPLQLKTAPPVVPVSTEVIIPTTTPTGGGNGQIAFVTDRTGFPQIWVMNSDGNESQQVTNFPDGACQPDWSPDGSQLIVTSPCRAKQDLYKGASLFFIKPDGSGLFPLPSAPGGDFDPAWSPDGGQIIFSSIRDGNYSSLYSYDVEKHVTQRLFTTNTNDRRPAWSPDGQKIVFETTRLEQQQIWIVDRGGHNPQAFSNQNSASYMPVWSPDGGVIVFSQGSNLPWLTAKQASIETPEYRISDIRPALNADYSPDGFWLVFEGLIELFRMMVNGSNLTRLTIQTGKDFDPAWRP
jgi:hypothetical protein